ncbi:Dipeptidyl aminopeptidase/acylaminoacyl peptidase [Amycolatopsis marina]|uniref:Dipeptidyl aminopeptidase/acylaminoacyl peptidase n=1 Tax=Amycolatopsis marina TaxID=490629 RepID=A0A1I1BRU6_9PSEU|nr:S9 family peptidase [Amycolatopsis marina]SFB52552.1 Dipeptidyl aminopeptidase/acylaminoacyl peptidase [Amycolatopsis marina]
MRPADIELLTVPGSLTLRGDLLVAGLSRPDLADNSYRSSLRRIGLGGGDLPWTRGTRDSAPVLSPDGRWIAFLRAGTGDGPAGSAQLHLMPTDGGEAVRLTSLPLGAGAPVWDPASARIAFVARVPEPGRYGTRPADGAKDVAPAPADEAPRRITRLDYRIDDIGFLLDRPARLFVLDVEEALRGVGAGEPVDPEPLTDGPADVCDPAWTPDGDAMLVSAARDWARTETVCSDLYRIPVAGGEPELVVRSEGTADHAVVAEDGTIWFYGTEFAGLDDIARNTGLWAAALPEPGGQPSRPRRVTDAESVDCAPGAGVPVVRGEDVLVVVRHRGAAELRAVPKRAERASLAALRLLAGERSCVRTFTADGERIAAVVATAESGGEVVLIEQGEQRVLTDFSAPVRKVGVRPLHELTATSTGDYPVHGWLVLPEGKGPHPVLLLVHGGPFAPYEWSLFDEAQVYASAGYAVVLANPRGSAGYGQEHGRTVIGGLGTVDADDLLAMLDAALERPDLDSARVGVMGGSYGGFMTGWLAAHHGHRFRAAWSERAVNAWDSFAGSSDIGWMFAQGYIGTDPEEQRKRSPLSYAGQIGLPFAVVHSEQDWRCPLEQAQRMFVALRQNGVEAELILFPGEGHELTRTGSPRHRRQRFDAVLEWWSRHLG